MMRRVVFASALLAVIGGAGAAYADNSPSTPLTHEVCVVTSDDPNHQHTQDFCVTWGDIHTP